MIKGFCDEVSVKGELGFGEKNYSHLMGIYFAVVVWKKASSSTLEFEGF